MLYLPASQPRFKAGGGAVWDHGGDAPRPLSHERARSLCAFFRSESLKATAACPAAARFLRDRFLELHGALTDPQLPIDP
jgi:hypothetical protein